MQCQQVHRDLDCRFMAPRPRATVSPLSCSPSPRPISSPRGVIWLRCLPGPLRSTDSDTTVLKSYLTAFVVVAFCAVVVTLTSGVRDIFCCHYLHYRTVIAAPDLATGRARQVSRACVPRVVRRGIYYANYCKLGRVRACVRDLPRLPSLRSVVVCGDAAQGAAIFPRVLLHV